MPVSVLIPPDNRLLGSALSDLTLYGAQPTDMTIGRVQDGASALAPNASPTSAPGSDAAAPSESERAADDTTALLSGDEAQSPLPSPSTLAVPLDPPLPATAEPQGSIPQPVGSGSFLQAPIVTPHQAATADHGGGGVPIVGSTDGVAATLTNVAVATPDSLSHIGVATLGTDALDAVGTIDTVVAHLGSSDLLPAGADIAGLAGAALDATPLSALGGSDPAAGLQTLIGMVDSADAFDLGHATNAVDSTPGSILDALTADEAPSVLLGGDGDAAHHGLDDHGIHLGV